MDTNKEKEVKLGLLKELMSLMRNSDTSRFPTKPDVGEPELETPAEKLAEGGVEEPVVQVVAKGQPAKEIGSKLEEMLKAKGLKKSK